MKGVTIRELRNHGGRVVDRVLAGETMVVTRAGKPVAELKPLRRPTLPREELLARWRVLPAVDPDALRRDVDRFLDPEL